MTLSAPFRRPRAVLLAAALLLLTGLLGLTRPQPAEASTTAWSRYAPLVYLHPDESYLPMAVPTFLNHSRLRWSHDFGCTDHQLAGIGQVNATSLGAGTYQHQEENDFCQHGGQYWTSNQMTRPRQDGGPSGGEGFFLDLDNTYRHGAGTSAPVYYDYRAGQYVTYWFFSGFNDALTSVADHEGDWERVSVRLDASDNALTVAYFEHTGYCVLPWSSAPHTSDGRPVAYSAIGTHASYPTAGTHDLDETAAGPAWSTWSNLLAVHAQPWYGFGGGWGEVGETEYTTGVLGPSSYKPPAPSDWSGPSC